MIYAVVILLSLAAAMYFMTAYAFKHITIGRKYSIEDCFELVECRVLYSKEKFDSQGWEEVSVTSQDGFKLKGFYFQGDRDLNRAMIIVHGYQVAFPWSLQFAELFIKRGWSILIIDQRGHGHSEGKYTTYGFYEKLDLDLWVNLVVSRNNPGCVIGLHGQSMGGGTVLEYAAINKHAKFIIADCPYSDLTELIKYHIRKLNHMPSYPLIYLIDLMLSWKAKFRLRDVSPIRALERSSIPIMFVHGGEDHFVPTYMSAKMYRAKKDKRKILVIDAAKHGMSYSVAPEKYEREVMKFIDSVI